MEILLILFSFFLADNESWPQRTFQLVVLKVNSWGWGWSCQLVGTPQWLLLVGCSQPLSSTVNHCQACLWLWLITMINVMLMINHQETLLCLWLISMINIMLMINHQETLLCYHSMILSFFFFTGSRCISQRYQVHDPPELCWRFCAENGGPVGAC